MREKLLRNLARLAYRYPWWILGIAGIVTILSILISQNLELSMRWSDLMPENDPRSIEFNRVLEKYKSASSIMIVLKGDEQHIKAFAEEAALSITEISASFNGEEEELIKRVTYKEDEDFLRRNGLMLTKTKDLENSKDMFSDVSLLPLMTHINDNLERTYIYSDDEEKLSNREKSDNAIHYLDGLKYWLQTMESYTEDTEVSRDRVLSAADRLLIGDLHFISYDHSMLMMLAQPSFPVTDAERGKIACDSIEAILADVGQKYPGVETGLTGMLALARDELVAVQSDMNYLSFVALFLILVLFIVSFRMWVAPLFAVAVLIVGVVWTMAFATLTVGTLNIMTAMFAVILVGLGIDFSVHIISGFAENRGKGMNILKSAEQTLLKAGPGITTGGLTTGIAFLTLMISDSRGMHDFGLIAGGGVIICMVAALMLLPPFLVIRERRQERRGRSTTYHPPEFRFIGAVAETFARGRVVVLAVMILLTGFFAYHTFQLAFDYDMLNIEPKDMASVIWYDSLMAAYDMSPDYALVTSSSLDSMRIIAHRAKDFPNIAWVDAITEYLPTNQDQAERGEIIAEIRTELEKHPTATEISTSDLDAILDELHRLWMNVVEMSDMAFQAGQDRLEGKTYELSANPEIAGSPDYIQGIIEKLKEDPTAALNALNRFQEDYFIYFRKTALGMTAPEPISLETLPESITSRYLSDDGETYLVSLFPEQDLWNMDNLEAFDRQLRSISPRATGTPPLFLAMIEIIGNDGKRATILAFITILVLLFLDFRRIDLTLMAVIPLVAGTLWMAGLLHLTGQKLNVVNIEAIPLILGIGIDYGVHLIHRFRIEGRDRVKVIFSSTGKAIMLSALTTMIGFGSLSFMTHRGMASMGVLLFIGVGTCFLTALGLLAPVFGKERTVNR
ncbi:hypothetical protein CEE37_13255 [candidate division LCP-89 bacterium B3_LCP]|uniref:SSD domain-containing protein n=1 Tax=candidate division LCP-89 bacterium B3_LCP TaxID=2012998 RepID=A0A532USN4_UNCL8|nr:MAG: hypothetical protein CEE37_13255 [candidate division LCP-89 bacterium B3_LCP]